MELNNEVNDWIDPDRPINRGQEIISGAGILCRQREVFPQSEALKRGKQGSSV